MPVQILRRAPLAILLALSLVAVTLLSADASTAGANVTLVDETCLGTQSDADHEVVRVSSTAELQRAAANLTEDTVIVLESGDYNVTLALFNNRGTITLRVEGNGCGTAPPVGPTSTTTTTVAPPQPAPEPVTDPLVTETDVAYQGSFRVPYGDGSNESSLAWGGAGLGYNPNRNSLFITGHSWHQLTAEISIPPLGRSQDPSSLPQATFLQRPEDATDGKLSTVSEPQNQSFDRIGGYLVDGEDLIVSGYNFYDAGDDQVRSHLLTDINLDASSNFVALTDDVQPRWLGGAMTAIPEAWQGAFGDDTFMSGLAGISIVSNSSVGPSAATFTRDSLTGSDPAKLVLGYPLSNPLDTYEARSALWNGTSEVRGMVFPEDSSSVLYFGTHGIGEFCYGTGQQCGDPLSPYQGTHAYPYRYQVWAYDAADLAAVYAGNAEPDSVRPYDVWELPLPYSTSTIEMDGATYDPTTGRIFVSQAFADGDNPVIHVFTLN